MNFVLPALALALVVCDWFAVRRCKRTSGGPATKRANQACPASKPGGNATRPAVLRRLQATAR